MISNIKTLVGSTVLYVRFDCNDSNITTHGVCYSTTNNTPTTSDSTSTSYWDETYQYLDIVYIDNLLVMTKYYIRPYVISNENTIYGDVVKIYTTMKGTISVSYNPDMTDGKCIITLSNNDKLDWTDTLSRIKECTSYALKYYEMSGYVPDCSYTTIFNESYVNGTASMNSNTAQMSFYNIGYAKIYTIIHELSHFMDYDFQSGLSNNSFKSQNSFGYILGKKMQEFCRFWMNTNTANVACHASHCYPFSDYDSNYQCQYTSYQDLLHRSGAMFNVVKGYDGFIGISNQKLITPCYTIDEDYYYYIYSRNNKRYATDYNEETPIIAWKSHTPTYEWNIIHYDNDDMALWKLSYNPTNGTYIILNKAYPTHYFTLDDTNGLTTTETSLLVVPTIYTSTSTIYDYDSEGNYKGDETFAIMQFTSTYEVERNCLCDTSSDSGITTEVFNPRLYTHNFMFVKSDKITE